MRPVAEGGARQRTVCRPETKGARSRAGLGGLDKECHPATTKATMARDLGSRRYGRVAQNRSELQQSIHVATPGQLTISPNSLIQGGIYLVAKKISVKLQNLKFAVTY